MNGGTKSASLSRLYCKRKQPKTEEGGSKMEKWEVSNCVRQKLERQGSNRRGKGRREGSNSRGRGEREEERREKRRLMLEQAQHC